MDVAEKAKRVGDNSGLKFSKKSHYFEHIRFEEGEGCAPPASPHSKSPGLATGCILNFTTPSISQSFPVNSTKKEGRN